MLNAILSGSHVIDKFLILPILVSPVFILVYFLGRKRLESRIDIYKDEPSHIRKRKGWGVVIYIIITLILIQLAIASPLYAK